MKKKTYYFAVGLIVGSNIFHIFDIVANTFIRIFQTIQLSNKIYHTFSHSIKNNNNSTTRLSYSSVFRVSFILIKIIWWNEFTYVLHFNISLCLYFTENEVHEKWFCSLDFFFIVIFPFADIKKATMAILLLVDTFIVSFIAPDGILKSTIEYLFWLNSITSHLSDAPNHILTSKCLNSAK